MERSLTNVVLPIGLFGLLTGMFWVGDRSLFHKLFYVTVAFPAAVALIVRPALVFDVLRSPVGWPFLAFSAFTLASLTWSGTDASAWSLAKRPLYVFLLLVAAVAVGRARISRIPQVLVGATLTAGVAGAVFLLHFLGAGGPRLTGEGALYNPLLTSHVFGFFAALSAAAWAADRRHVPVATVVTTLVLGSVILATGSRTPLVALAVTAIWLCALVPGKRAHWALGLLVVAGGIYVTFAPEAILSRGFSYRPEIWTEAWRQVLGAPLLGHGYEHPMQIQLDGFPFAFTDPHNIALAVLYQEGLVGLGLWLWLYAAALTACWRNRNDALVLVSSAALVFGLAASMTEGGDFLSRPKEHWFLIWIPFALVAAATLPRQAVADSTNFPESGRPKDRFQRGEAVEKA